MGRRFFFITADRESLHFSRKVNIEVECDRILVVSVLYDEHDLIFANVYAPNDSREKISFLRTYRNRSVPSVKIHSCFLTILIVRLKTN